MKFFHSFSQDAVARFVFRGPEGANREPVKVVPNIELQVPPLKFTVKKPDGTDFKHERFPLKFTAKKPDGTDFNEKLPLSSETKKSNIKSAKDLHQYLFETQVDDIIPGEELLMNIQLYLKNDMTLRTFSDKINGAEPHKIGGTVTWVIEGPTNIVDDQAGEPQVQQTYLAINLNSMTVQSVEKKASFPQPIMTIEEAQAIEEKIQKGEELHPILERSFGKLFGIDESQISPFLKANPGKLTQYITYMNEIYKNQTSTFTPVETEFEGDPQRPTDELKAPIPEPPLPSEESPRPGKIPSPIIPPRAH